MRIGGRGEAPLREERGMGAFQVEFVGTELAGYPPSEERR
jgi:hypothetical protein